METDTLACAVAECDSLVESRNVCAHHLRRIISGNVFFDPEFSDLVDHCNEGHPLCGDNVRWESSGRKGKRRRRCRACLRIRAQRQAQLALDVIEPPKPYRPDDLTLTEAIDDFELAKSMIDGNCKGAPEQWMDWDEPPTPEDAKSMCSGCPLMQACANYATAAQEWHGVWGGVVIHQGVKL